MNKVQLYITALTKGAEEAKELLSKLEALHDKYEVVINLQIDQSLPVSRELI